MIPLAFVLGFHRGASEQSRRAFLKKAPANLRRLIFNCEFMHNLKLDPL